MNDFTYYNPTKIEFGKEKEKNIGKYLKEAGVKSVLLTYGMQSIKKSGLYTDVITALNEEGIKYTELSGIISNPVLTKVNEGIKLCKDENLDAVLAVGGGSVADSAKAIALGSLYDGDVWDFFIQKAKITKALPVYTIMTLAATASEMNGNAVILNESTKQKYAVSSVLLNPKLSIVNPLLMNSVSDEYLAYSAVDIITHSLEVYFTATNHPVFNSRLVESIIKTVIETTEILLEDPNNYDARAQFAWAAIQALNGLLPSGTQNGIFPNHLIEHSVSAYYKVAHGAGLAIILPAWMKWHNNQNEEQYLRFAKEIFQKDTIDEGILALEIWFNKINAPTRLKQIEVKEENLDTLANNANELARYWAIDSIYTKDVIKTILQKAL